MCHHHFTVPHGTKAVFQLLKLALVEESAEQHTVWSDYLSYTIFSPQVRAELFCCAIWFSLHMQIPCYVYHAVRVSRSAHSVRMVTVKSRVWVANGILALLYSQEQNQSRIWNFVNSYSGTQESNSTKGVREKTKQLPTLPFKFLLNCIWIATVHTYIYI